MNVGRTEAAGPGQVRAVVLFAAAYMIAATVVALGRGNQEFVFYIVVMLILAVLVWIIHRQVGLTAGLLWCLAVWGLAHMAGGLVPIEGAGVLYNLWLIPERIKYDQVVHAFGFGVTTWMCWQVLRRHLSEPPPLKGPLILCVAAGMGFGAMNEIVEFAATKLVPETNVGGYDNTGWDLVANAVGCITAALLIARAERARRA